MISKDMLQSKKIDQAFRDRMSQIENSIKSIENRHLLKFDNASKTSELIDHKLNSTNQKMMELKQELKRLIQFNTDKISHLKVHASAVDKFEEMTKRKIEDIGARIKTNRIEAQDNDQALERRLTTRFDRFENKTEEKFTIIQKGKFSAFTSRNKQNEDIRN
jgi:hypothetical protein